MAAYTAPAAASRAGIREKGSRFLAVIGPAADEVAAKAFLAALASLATVARVPTVRLVVQVPYEKVGAVKRLLRPPEVELAAEEYGAAARLVLAVHAARLAALREALAELGAASPPVSPAPILSK